MILKHITGIRGGTIARDRSASQRRIPVIRKVGDLFCLSPQAGIFGAYLIKKARFFGALAM
jgi:hypothetical protein